MSLIKEISKYLKEHKKVENELGIFQIEKDNIPDGGTSLIKVATCNNEKYVIKFLLQNIDLNETREYKRFSQAYHIVSELKSDVILPQIGLYSLEIQKGVIVPYTVMPKAYGTLKDFKKNNEITFEIFESIFHRMIYLIKEIHKHKIIHRDLKPENIFLLDGTIESMVLGDFDIAKFDDELYSKLHLTEKKERLANYLYSAPEQKSNKTYKIAETADLYAFGQILHWLLMDEPLMGQSKINFDDERLKKYESIVKTLLKDNPKDRFQTVEEIKGNKSREEIRIDAINILKILIVAKRDFDKLSINRGVKESTNKIYYEYFHYLDGRINKGYVFLGNDIILKNIFPSIEKKLKEDKIDSLEIFLAKSKRDNGIIIDKKKAIYEYISENFFKKIISNDKVQYIDDFIWNCTLKNSIDSNMVEQRQDFIDQILYQEDGSIENLSLEFFQKEINNQDVPISVVYGSGGVGKTTFCDALKYKIEIQDTKKKVFYIKGEKIVDILSDNDINFYEINSLNDLYELFKDENDFDNFGQEEFILNYISGNILVIIDAIEEIESALGDKFILDNFFNSLQKLNENFFSTKIIITTRDTFVGKIKKLPFNSDIQYFQLLGFTHDDLDNFLEKRYEVKEKRLEVKKYIKNNDFFNENQKKYIIPLFVDWICKIIDRPEDTKLTKSRFFLKGNDIDRLLIRLINREIGKQSLQMNLDDMFELLQTIILEKNGSISEEDFAHYIEGALGDTEIDKYIKNPLFILYKDNSIRIKYDILDNFIKVRTLRYNLLKKLDSISLLKDCYDGTSELYLEFLEIFQGEDILKYLQYQIKILSKKLEDNKFEKSIEKENIKKSISAILYMAFELLVTEEEQRGKERYTKLIQELYNMNKSINKLFIYGKFYSLDFREINIRDSEFNRYANFIDCSFPSDNSSPIFYYTKFSNIQIPKSQKIHSKLFDNTCQYPNSNIDEIIKLNDMKQENEKEKIYKSIQFVCKKINTSRKSLKVLKNGKNIKYHKGESIFLENLIKINLLKKVIWKTEEMYILNQEYYDDLHDIRIGEFPIELEDKINEIFEL